MSYFLLVDFKMSDLQSDREERTANWGLLGLLTAQRCEFDVFTLPFPLSL